jgi:hypothetical protein
MRAPDQGLHLPSARNIVYVIAALSESSLELLFFFGGQEGVYCNNFFLRLFVRAVIPIEFIFEIIRDSSPGKNMFQIAARTDHGMETLTLCPEVICPAVLADDKSGRSTTCEEQYGQEPR